MPERLTGFMTRRQYKSALPLPLQLGLHSVTMQSFKSRCYTLYSVFTDRSAECDGSFLSEVVVTQIQVSYALISLQNNDRDPLVTYKTRFILERSKISCERNNPCSL